MMVWMLAIKMESLMAEKTVSKMADMMEQSKVVMKELKKDKKMEYPMDLQKVQLKELQMVEMMEL